MQNASFHITILAGIIVGVSSIFYFTGNLSDRPAVAPTIIEQPSKSIWIEEASWGLDCVEEIERRALHLRQELKISSNEDYEQTTKELEALPAIPARNNVLQAVSIACNSKQTCEVTADWEGLSLATPESSFCGDYQLEIRYRCEKFGRYISSNTYMGDTAKLECPK